MSLKRRNILLFVFWIRFYRNYLNEDTSRYY